MTRQEELNEQQERQKIDWPSLQGNFWRPEPGHQYDVVLANWGMTQTDFGGREKEPKPVLEFDVLRVDNITFDEPKTFATAALSFVKEVKPLIEEAESRGLTKLNVIVKFSNDKKYTVLGLKSTQYKTEDR